MSSFVYHKQTDCQKKNNRIVCRAAQIPQGSLFVRSKHIISHFRYMNVDFISIYSSKQNKNVQRGTTLGFELDTLLKWASSY